mmetsp:Transcript_59491/g.88340  ORF Transcript_59491/g.88340 Transcript_59491/m.88340 type:complete len:97 (-) Transcript_59491:33-323(-)
MDANLGEKKMWSIQHCHNCHHNSAMFFHQCPDIAAAVVVVVVGHLSSWVVGSVAVKNNIQMTKCTCVDKNRNKATGSDSDDNITSDKDRGNRTDRR